MSKWDHRYSEDRSNLAYRRFPALIEGFGQILAGSSLLLRPGGVLAVTTRPFRVKGELVDLPGEVLAAAENAGLVLQARLAALLCGIKDGQLVARASFFQILENPTQPRRRTARLRERPRRPPGLPAGRLGPRRRRLDMRKRGRCRYPSRPHGGHRQRRGQAVMRIAFYGRIDDWHGAEMRIMKQRELCQRVLNPCEQITTVFFDVGESDLLPEGFALGRDGSMTDLLREARDPFRRFDLVIARSSDRLEHRGVHYSTVLLRLTTAGVPVRVARRLSFA
ncbi:hypothetical protein LO762_14660 [Actinocorallia sp. API 0066]|uniref:hypothetical protein n=1 Tax=Actinocorallia sp. API 0066 TaxID=2896846 RepID=UPI001E2A1AAC|nr:hypothetical protein [Actinocorallia sp. API 0066]MCD0450423.1 hypothetical protein [Actinocorallia sp. API 0066]